MPILNDSDCYFYSFSFFRSAASFVGGEEDRYLKIVEVFFLILDVLYVYCKNVEDGKKIENVFNPQKSITSMLLT